MVMKMVEAIHARRIDDEVWKKFKEAVIEEHGKLNGVLGEELTKAMELYLEAQSGEGYTHTHRKTKDKNEMYRNGGKPSNKGMMTLEEIKSTTSHLVDAVYNGGEVSVDAFKRIIREYAGLDTRTVNKYQKILFEEHDLEIVRGFVRPIL